MSTETSPRLRQRCLACAAAIAVDPRFDPKERLVVIRAVTHYVHRKPGPRFGTLWPAIATLANETGAGERTARRAMGKARECSIFEVVRHGGGARVNSTIYRLIWASQEAGTPASLGTPAKFDTSPLPRLAPNPYRKATSEEYSRHDIIDADGAVASAAAEPTILMPLARPLPFPAAEPTKRDKSTRGSRLPADWQPSFADIDFAISHGLDPGWTADTFCDYWAGKGGAAGCKLDWSATWRNWCRREADSRSPARGNRSESNRQGNSEIAAALHRISFASGEDAGETPITPPAPHDLGEPGDRLTRLLNPAMFQAWFARLRVASLDATTLRLIAPNSFVQGKLISKYQGLIATTWGVERVEIDVASQRGAA